MRRHWRFVLLIFFVGLWGWSLSTPAYAQHTVNNSEPDSAATGISTADTPNGIAILLPPNFIGSTVVSHLSFPTDMVILPNGDFLVTEKGTGSHEFSRAKVRLVRAGVLLPAPVLTLSVNSFIDSGLM